MPCCFFASLLFVFKKIEAKISQSRFSINLLVIQKYNLNPLQRHFKNTKKRPLAHAVTQLTVHNRIDSEWRSQSEYAIHDRTLVDLYLNLIETKKCFLFLKNHLSNSAYTCDYLRIFFDLRVIKSTTNVSLGGI